MNSDDFDAQVDRFRAAARDAESWSAAAQQMYGQVAAELEDAVQLLESYRQRFDELQQQLAAAVRWRDRFRLALHVYLEERKQIGPYAPTTDTALMIERTIKEADA